MSMKWGPTAISDVYNDGRVGAAKNHGPRHHGLSSQEPQWASERHRWRLPKRDTFDMYVSWNVATGLEFIHPSRSAIDLPRFTSPGMSCFVASIPPRVPATQDPGGRYPEAFRAQIRDARIIARLDLGSGGYSPTRNRRSRACCVVSIVHIWEDAVGAEKDVDTGMQGSVLESDSEGGQIGLMEVHICHDTTLHRAAAHHDTETRETGPLAQRKRTRHLNSESGRYPDAVPVPVLERGAAILGEMQWMHGDAAQSCGKLLAVGNFLWRAQVSKRATSCENPLPGACWAPCLPATGHYKARSSMATFYML
ncbi:hypothetical protein BV22DRAFT_1116703 [Leucogyrophana mollusca]|uniref:Uncharacterized protein n=1 Tax=Leucogyrophana mollusca TaxID=85980 RepID=A0ACB8BUL4_9AGAM|nr:hypothetical protein BV22DRAFT_1116703 [Leucogyrophana mollusca]